MAEEPPTSIDLEALFLRLKKPFASSLKSSRLPIGMLSESEQEPSANPNKTGHMNLRKFGINFIEIGPKLN